MYTSYRENTTSRYSVASPGVKGFPGEQGAVIVVTDKIRCHSGAAAACRLADCAYVHFVFRVPYVQQENIIDQDGVRWNHTTC